MTVLKSLYQAGIIILFTFLGEALTALLPALFFAPVANLMDQAKAILDSLPQVDRIMLISSTVTLLAAERMTQALIKRAKKEEKHTCTSKTITHP